MSKLDGHQLANLKAICKGNVGRLLLMSERKRCGMCGSPQHTTAYCDIMGVKGDEDEHRC
ncbi:hypothetical protein LCGC14_0264920 [marine sediment metagenome]|uniref:Uncharacterized protein n=1 Tax=marine sediment metagenome TaxID=412755 RepID=A0A0F9U5P5_9ZZZZ